jgi:hypothetical protein
VILHRAIDIRDTGARINGDYFNAAAVFTPHRFDLYTAVLSILDDIVSQL